MHFISCMLYLFLLCNDTIIVSGVKFVFGFNIGFEGTSQLTDAQYLEKKMSKMI